MRVFSAVCTRLAPLALGVALAAGCETATITEAAANPGTVSEAKGVAASSWHNGDKLVPFWGRQEFGPDGGEIACGALGTFPAIWRGTGPASHFGWSETVATWTSCGLVGGHVVTEGTAVVTAANGDELHLTFTQTFIVIDPNVYSEYILDPVTITGGTGRFAGVTGYATGSGTTGVGSFGTWEMSGWMTPPGVGKHSMP